MLSTELGIVIAVAGLFLSYLAYQLNRTKSFKTSTQESAELKAELVYIRKGVDDIRIDLKTNERQMSAFGERITRVEESTKQAHKRIDNLVKGE